MNFRAVVDRMFALLGNFNRHNSNQHLGVSLESGGRDQALTSTSPSASTLYLTTLAMPALLLQEATAEALREALGLQWDENSSDWFEAHAFLDEREESLEGNEEPQSQTVSSDDLECIPCDCSNFS